MRQERTVIKPEYSWALEWHEIKSNFELLYFFAWRNFKVRYKQTLIGALWAVVRPFTLMVVFTIVFNRGAGIQPDGNVPYAVFSYAGLLFWNYFSQSVSQVSSSLVAYQNIIKKIYFPRLLVPVSTAITGLIDFALSVLIFIGLVIHFDVSIQVLGMVLFIPLLVMTILTVLGVGLFMAALNVRYRDVEQLMPFLVQVLLFITPVIYPVSIVPASWQWILFINPMTAVVEVARYSLLGVGQLNMMGIGISIISCVVAVIAGLLFFKSQERALGDLI